MALSMGAEATRSQLLPFVERKIMEDHDPVPGHGPAEPASPLQPRVQGRMRRRRDLHVLRVRRLLRLAVHVRDASDVEDSADDGRPEDARFLRLA